LSLKAAHSKKAVEPKKEISREELASVVDSAVEEELAGKE
jgi:hypothetical protein